MVCSSFSDSSFWSFLDSRRERESSSSSERLCRPCRPCRVASSDRWSFCVEDTALEKPCTDFLRVARKMSSTSGDEGLLDTRLVSESMVCVQHGELEREDPRG